jgi:hypothetical protein
VLFFKITATLFSLNFLVEIQQIFQPVKYPNFTETEEEEKAKKPLLSKVFQSQTSLVAIVAITNHIMLAAVIDALYATQNT